MDKYLELYERNKMLDNMFYSKYSSDKELYEKNCLELIVELGELANESRCFKYWSIKKPNRELVLEEFADCLLMCLYFFNEYNINNVRQLSLNFSDNILVIFNELIRMCTLLMNRDNVDEMLLLEIFYKLLHLGKLLDFSDNEIINMCYKKIEKNEERLNSDY